MQPLFAVEVTDGAIIIALVGVFGPIAVIVTNFLISRSQQKADWKRQDVVALAVKAASQEQKVQNQRLETKIDEVHVLVNSKLTASLQQQASFLTQMIDLRSADITRLGTDADPGAVQRRDDDVKDLNRLNRVLADRDDATDVVDTLQKEL